MSKKDETKQANTKKLQEEQINECECNDCNCGEENKDYLEDLQRLQAEFDNYRKRNEFSVLRAKEEGVMQAVKNLLPVLDSFQSAQKHMKKDQLEGLLLVKEQLLHALRELGVTQIEALNKPFDPHFHNAVMVEDSSSQPSQTVLEVFQEGYLYKDKVIRHSMVKVSA
jgi:molecular chaperone GrpE